MGTFRNQVGVLRDRWADEEVLEPLALAVVADVKRKKKGLKSAGKAKTDSKQNAISDQTALILKVHQSNFYMGGFIENVETEELANLAHSENIPLFEDLGSGAVINTEEYGPVSHEPTPSEIISKGVDLLCYSGDKILGGAQAGIIAVSYTHLTLPTKA